MGWFPKTATAIVVVASTLSPSNNRLCHAATIYEGIASISSSLYPNANGTVRFSQEFGSSCVRVTANIVGLPEGLHGFHVHQYGDITSDTDKSSVGAHFVPTCVTRRILQDEFDPPPDDEGDMWSQCYNDSVHGLPPSNVRQSGDMGNIESINGVAAYDMNLCQDKMSLYDELKSVLGRSVVIHEKNDTGLPPFGLAGDPIAAGVIGLFDPDAQLATEGDSNGALPPEVPEISRVMCYLRGDLEGPVLIEKEILDTRASFSASLTPIEPASSDEVHSFHFHQYGDLSNVGDIWQFSKLNITELLIGRDESVVKFCESFNVDADLKDFVGRSLTIHGGPTASSPTVAAGICGLANPDASVSCTDSSQASESSTASLWVGPILIAVLASR